MPSAEAHHPLLDRLDPERVPLHVAITMDGNGRWAKQRSRPRVFGHKNGVEAVRASVRACRKAKVRYLTLYAFSTENWKRPEREVNALMELLVSSLRKETAELQENGVKIGVIGNVEKLPSVCRRELTEAMRITADNTDLTLTLALSYSGRWDILQAAKAIAHQAASGALPADRIDAAITESAFGEALSTHGIPDPELMIRTSGEKRISNYLLWQGAYSELYFTNTLWPDFREDDLYSALLDYQGRERRFGKTSEQIEVS
jgi:undecaprenyl diphosphate synthase